MIILTTIISLNNNNEKNNSKHRNLKIREKLILSCGYAEGCKDFSPEMIYNAMALVRKTWRLKWLSRHQVSKKLSTGYDFRFNLRHCNVPCCLHWNRPRLPKVWTGTIAGNNSLNRGRHHTPIFFFLNI